MTVGRVRAFQMLTWIVETVGEGIASVTWLAGANWTVVHDPAGTLLTTRVGTGVHALVVPAS